MATNKENVYKSKIPQPVGALPKLPKELLGVKKISHKRDTVRRIPLKTLEKQVSPKARPMRSLKKSQSFINLDDKHVTLRTLNEELDWNYNVFQDQKLEDSSVIFISDDDELSAATPDLQSCLPPDRVRNVKRSLKRPHSRELQGLSPMIPRENLSEKAKRRLPFTTAMQNTSYDFRTISYTWCLDKVYAEDIFDHLLSSESKLMSKPVCPTLTRSCIINWLLRVNGPDGNPVTIQIACWYLDTILCRHDVALRKLQLLAAACYWIAQKHEGPVARATSLVKFANNAFTVKSLRFAEADVLRKLNFPRQPIVVQNYIEYLSLYCDEQQSIEIEQAATFLYTCGLMVEKGLCEEYPSTLAAAAVCTVLVLLKRKHLLCRLEKCDVFQTAMKKSENFDYTCLVLRRAVNTVHSPNFEYKTPLQNYDSPPSFVAQKIIAALKKISVLNAKAMSGYF